MLLSLWGVRIDANRARNGAAIYARNLDRTGLAISARVEINLPGSRPDAMFCARPEDCGSIDGNLAVDQTDTPTDGAVLAADEGLVLLDKSRIRHNRAGSIVHATAGGHAYVANSLIADNQLTANVVRASDDSGCDLYQVTIAGNQHASPVIKPASYLAIRNSIIWQPGSLVSDTMPDVATNIVAHEVGSLVAGASGIEEDPRFIDPEHGDYRLQAASPAVDFAALDFRAVEDLDGRHRTIDLAAKENRFGGRDLGAFERQDIGNLVVNGGFTPRGSAPAAPLRRWTTSTPSLASWSADEGAPDSPGAVFVNFRPGVDPEPTGMGEGVAGAYTGLRQCMGLPGPGVYHLNAWTRVPGSLPANRDYARIRWTYRSASADCTGPATEEGVHYLARQSGWSQGNPASIAVPLAGFTDRGTIEIALQVQDGDQNATNPIDAWFDEVSLVLAQPAVRKIFRSGFENAELP